VTSEARPRQTWRERRAPLLWTGVALAAFVCATALRFSCLIGQDLTETVATNANISRSPMGVLSGTDQKFIVATVARNARALVRHPLTLFDSEFCYPTEKSLAYGEPLITMGIVGIPAELLSGDPILVYNSTLLLLPLISALAMFLLVRDWTGLPAAGIVAGLLYAFHRIKTFDVVHPYLYDHAWTVFALFFARRWFAAGRWRDALGVAASVSLQVLGCVYPLVAAGFVALPLLWWLVWQYGVRRLHPLQVAVVVIAAAAAAAFVFSPYLSLSVQGAYAARDIHLYHPWSYVLPGRPGFPGWSVLLLALTAFVVGRERSAGGISGNPRWALLAAGALVLSVSLTTAKPYFHPDVVFATSEDGVVNPYELLLKLVPRANILRGPGGMYSMSHLIICVLAGMGAAGLLRLVPRRWHVASAGLLVAAGFLDSVRPTALGLDPGFDYELVQERPKQLVLDLFSALDAQGDEGPVLELPLIPNHWDANASGMLVSAYHHRKTSACYNSFTPPTIDQVAEISRNLPAAAALRRVRELGFTTIVIHHGADRPGGRRVDAMFRRVLAKDGASLRLLAENEDLTALGIELPAEPQ
jgi:hypothetical protein